jgi:hypothetical protein
MKGFGITIRFQWTNYIYSLVWYKCEEFGVSGMKISALAAVVLVGCVQNIAAWKHASTAQFYSALKKNEMTLVACKF